MQRENLRPFWPPAIMSERPEPPEPLDVLGPEPGGGLDEVEVVSASVPPRFATPGDPEAPPQPAPMRANKPSSTTSGARR
jgi:hypothetical protein